MAEFHIETEERAEATSIKLAGELDSATAAQALQRFGDVLGQRETPVVLDLGGLTFIDSAGLRSIIMIEQLAEERGVAVTVVPPPPPLLELLDLTGLSGRLSFSVGTPELPRDRSFLERIELTLPRDPAAPRRAREELRRAFERRADEMEVATAVLLTSELVTNAVLHADVAEGDPVELVITVHADRLRVEISDGGSGFDPQELPERPPEMGGRGLIVVDRLAARWGTSTIPGTAGRPRFCVWYELETQSRESHSVADAG